MLNFGKLIAQIGEVGRESLVERQSGETVLRDACLVYEKCAQDPAGTASRLEQNRNLLLWPVALPLEPFGSCFPISHSLQPVTVVAADGSQIMPSRHEIHNCYLLNIGTVVVSYGVKLPAILESQPYLYHRPDDLYPLVDRRRLHIDELYVSLERNLLELETVTSLAVSVRERHLPVVAFLDGSLLPWSLEKMPDTYQREYVKRMVVALESLRQERLSIVGYLSQSRSLELVNLLRICACPYDKSDCRRFCGHLNEEAFPCSRIWPVTDSRLLASVLAPSARCPVFLSAASVSRLLPAQQQTCFVYLNVGYEVARLEFPRWMLDDKVCLDLAFQVVLAQVNKGSGYPVCLAEAHHLAVIKAADRKHFFELLERHLVSLGIERIAVSQKENRKRRSLI